MTTRLRIAIHIALIVICSPAFGQEVLPAITEPFAGTGTAQQIRPADRMVMWIPLQGSGSDLREATITIQKKVDAAKQTLKDLGVEEASFVTGALTINQDMENTSRQIAARLRQARASSPSPGAGEADGDAASAITIMTILRGSLPLPGATPPEILVSANELQNTIRNAKLNDDSEEKSLSPEQQELLEEVQMFHRSNDEQNPLEPVFLFTSTVTPQERSALLKEAFKNAESEARELAEATGATLGPVGTVRHNESLEDGGRDRRYGSPNQHLMIELLDELRLSGPVLQMIGDTPAELKYSVRITVGFNRP